MFQLEQSQDNYRYTLSYQVCILSASLAIPNSEV